MPKGSRGVKSGGGRQKNTSTKPFTIDGKTYRRTDNILHDFNGNKYYKLERQHGDNWHEIKAVGTLISIYQKSQSK